MHSAAFASDILERLEPRALLSGGFAEPGTIIGSGVQPPSSVVVADIDNDAIPDLIAGVGRQVVVRKGLGAGAFSDPQIVATFNRRVGLLAVVDLNADGRPDLFSVERGVANGWARTLLNGGDGFLLNQFRVPTAVAALAAGNLDADPPTEIALVGRGGNGIDELRVLEPVDATLAVVPPPGRTLRLLIDAGSFFTSPRISALTVADLPDDSADALVIAWASDDVASTDVGVFRYVNRAGDPLADAARPEGFAASARLEAIGDPRSFPGTVSSLLTGELLPGPSLDVVVTTLVAPANPSRGTFVATARALEINVSGVGANLVNEQVIDQRNLVGRAGYARTLAPEYRALAISDVNASGQPDVLVSVVQEFASILDGPTVRRASLVQIEQFSPPVVFAAAAPNIPSLTAFEAAVVLTRTFVGAPLPTMLGRPAIFTAARLRDVGRVDLVLADARDMTDAEPVISVYLSRADPSAAP